MFKVKMPLFNQEGGAGGDGSQQPGKTFTQAEVDAIMASRWKDSELTKTELKELTDLIKGFGYEGATPAEIKAQLKQDLEARTKQQEIKDLESEANKTGATPELLAEIKQLKSDLAKVLQKEEKLEKEQVAKQQSEAAWNENVKSFQEKHPEVDMEKLASNEKFLKFFSRANPSIPLVDVYETYIDLVGGAEAEAIAKMQQNNDRSTSSGKAKGDPAGGTYGLTEGQQVLAKKNDMSFKDYAELLKEIQ